MRISDWSSDVCSSDLTERRAMLEEAAGIAGLHVRRKDAEQKLRATETNLTRLGEIVADMELRANALRRQARAAEKYKRLSEEMDRKSVEEGKSVSVRVDLGGRRFNKKKNQKNK